MPEEVTSSSGARGSGPCSDPAPASVCPSVPSTPSSGVSTPCLTASTVHANQAQQCTISMPLVSCQLPGQPVMSQVQVAPPANTVVQASLPHVQVIHQPIQSPSFLQQQHYMVQQQFMFHNAVQAAMQAQGMSPQLTLTPVGPNRPASIGPVPNTVTIQSPLPQGSQAVQMKPMIVAQNGSAVTQTVKTLGSKAATVMPQQQTVMLQQQAVIPQQQTVIPQQQTVIPQQQTVIPQQQTVIPQQQTVIPQQQATATMFGQKPLLQRQPLVIGQLGVLPTQALVGQPKSSMVGQNGQTRKSPTQIRFSNQPTLVTNTAQLLSGNQALLNHIQAIASLQQNMPLAQQLASQAGTILSTQPLYIRTTGPILQPQTVIGNVQAVAPTLGKSGSDVRGQLRTVVPGQVVKAIPNILPHIVRTMAPTQATQRMVSVAPATQGGATSKAVQTNSTKQIAAKARAPKNQSTKPVVRNTAQQQHHSWGGGTAQPPTAKVQPKPAVQSKKADTTKVCGMPSQTPQKTSMLVAASPAPVANSSAVQVLCHANGNAADKPLVATTTTPAKTVIPAIGTTANQPKVALSTVAMTTAKRQQAIVKPHILTHVIEGFIIQEAAQPFPVERSSLLTDYAQCQPLPTSTTTPAATCETNVEPPSIPPSHDASVSDLPSVLPKTKPPRSKSSRRHSPGSSGSMKCEFCGKVDFAYKFRRSKRFCSMACAKRYNVGCSRRMHLFTTSSGARFVRKKRSMSRMWKQTGGRMSSGPLQRVETDAFGNVEGHQDTLINDNDDAATTSAPSVPESSSESSEPSGSCSGPEEESSGPRSPPELERVTDMEVEVLPPTRRHPSQWTVSEVLQFVRDLPGCCLYADEFSRQEIDGQALMLLKEDHLMTTMNIKLGPALKICARINTLKDELS